MKIGWQPTLDHNRGSLVEVATHRLLERMVIFHIAEYVINQGWTVNSDRDWYSYRNEAEEAWEKMPGTRRIMSLKVPSMEWSLKECKRA